ncbi:MAG: response regulator [Polyangiales bacterium]
MNTLVVIDDSEPDRYLVRRVLGRAKPDVHFVEYTSAVEALDVFLEEDDFDGVVGTTPPPALVFLDINMPQMNGFEFLDRIKESASRKKCFVVVMFSSSNNPDDRQRASEFDFVADYMVKPITTAKLLAVSEREEFKLS